MATNWQSSKILNTYYEKVARAAAGIGSCPVITSFKAGFGYVDETDPAAPFIEELPGGIDSVPAVFYEGGATAQYSNGIVAVVCQIPLGAVSEPTRFSVVGIYDQDDELIAISVTLPDWITPNETYDIYPTLTFPLED